MTDTTVVQRSTDETTVQVGTSATVVSQAEATTIVTAGVAGPQGTSGWVVLTQSQYDALPSPDPSILYIVIGA